MEDVRRAARVRAGAGPAGLVATGRAPDLARRSSATGRPGPGAGSARCSSTPAAGWGASTRCGTDGAAFAEQLGGGRFDVVGWALRGTTGARPAVRCFADQRSRDRFGRRRRSRRRPRRGARSCRRPSPTRDVAGGRAGASSPTSRPRTTRAPRPPTRARRRPSAQLPGRVLRHVPRPDLRQPVPAPRARDGARDGLLDPRIVAVRDRRPGSPTPSPAWTGGSGDSQAIL